MGNAQHVKKLKAYLKMVVKYNKGMPFILGAAFLFYLVFIYRTIFFIDGEMYFTLVDDAMISMKYARNLANGMGLVWNIGEFPVQGFTNMGWTLYMAILHLIPISGSKISLLVMLTSVFLLLGNTFLIFKICEMLEPKMKQAAIIAAIITAFYYPLVFWSLRGMEVGLLTLLVNLSVLLVIHISQTISIKKLILLSGILLLALLVRMDVLLSVFLILVYLYSHTRIRQTIHFWLLTTLISVGFIAIIVFSYMYFGDIYPNTYYLKVEGVSFIVRVKLGIAVFVEYASRDFIMLLLISVAGLFVYRDLRNKESFLLLGIFFVQCIYSIYVGGDYAEPYNAIPQVDAANRFIT